MRKYFKETDGPMLAENRFESYLNIAINADEAISILLK